jgi:hypothetical protein
VLAQNLSLLPGVFKGFRTKTGLDPSLQQDVLHLRLAYAGQMCGFGQGNLFALIAMNSEFDA